MRATSHGPPELHNKMIQKYWRYQVGSVLWNHVTMSSKGSSNYLYTYYCYLRWGSRRKESTNSLKHILSVAAASLNLGWRLLSNNVSAAHHSSRWFFWIVPIFLPHQFLMYLLRWPSNYCCSCGKCHAYTWTEGPTTAFQNTARQPWLHPDCVKSDPGHLTPA